MSSQNITPEKLLEVIDKMCGSDWPDEGDPLDNRRFYELMQVYRHTPPVRISDTVAAYEAVKLYLRRSYPAIVQLVAKERRARLSK